MGLSPFTAGSAGRDGLLVIRPDGKLYVHQGIGNLGTHSIADTARPAADVLDLSWDQVVIVWGDTSKHLPFSTVQAGSQTTHAHTRANHAAGTAMLGLLQELAARELGGSPTDYRVADGRVFRAGNRAAGMNFAEAARRAIATGGQVQRGRGPGGPQRCHQGGGGGPRRRGASSPPRATTTPAVARSTPGSPPSPRSSSTSRPAKWKSSTSRPPPTAVR